MSFVAIVVFTRLLSREDFGVYSVTLASVNVVTAGLFHWLGLSVVRFGVRGGLERSEYLSAIALLYCIAVGLSLLAVVTFAAMCGWSFGQTGVIGVALVIFESWFMLNQRLAIALIQPARLAIMSTAKALIGLCAGAWAAHMGYGSKGVLSGIALGSVCAGVIPSQLNAWREVGLGRVTRRHVSEVWRYGGPLGVTVAFGFALTAIDRSLLTSFHGAEMAGEYSAGFDLANSAVLLALTSVNIAAFPPLLERAEREDAARIAARLKGNLDLLLLVSLPILAALVSLSSNVSAVLLGPEFSRTAAWTIPWIAVGAYFGGIRSFYFDIVFHLDKDSRTILVVASSVLLVNAVVNVVLVPRWGIAGAIVSMCAAQVVGITSSYWWGRGRRVRTLLPDVDSLKLMSAGALAAVSVWPIAGLRGGIALLVQLLVVCIVYGAGLVVLRARAAADLRQQSLRAFSRARSRLARSDG